jgi:peroxiredoxin
MKRISIAAAGFLAFFALRSFSLTVGDTAPDFTLTTIDNASYSLSNHQGQIRVVFFFGCG